jgi:hypothetical protein
VGNIAMDIWWWFKIVFILYLVYISLTWISLFMGYIIHQTNKIFWPSFPNEENIDDLKNEATQKILVSIPLFLYLALSSLYTIFR